MVYTYSSAGARGDRSWSPGAPVYGVNLTRSYSKLYKKRIGGEAVQLAE